MATPAAANARTNAERSAVMPDDQVDLGEGLPSPPAPQRAADAVLSALTTAFNPPSTTEPGEPKGPPFVMALLALARREIEQSMVNRSATKPSQGVTVVLDGTDVGEPVSIPADDLTLRTAKVKADKPVAPAAPDVTPTAKAVLVSWAPPDSASPLTRFSLRYRTHGGTWAFANDAPASATATVIAGLAPTTAYEFAVRASNASGNSPWSKSALTLTTGQVGQPTPAPAPGSNPNPALPEQGKVLWHDRFDTAPVGRLVKATGDAAFGPTAAPTGGATYVNGTIVSDPAGGKFLRHTIPAGQLGAFIVSPELSRDVEHAVLEYDIRFDENFDWRWGGKIPGLVGVAPGQSIYAPTSGRSNRAVGFSTRLMWHGRGDDGSRPFQGKLGPIPAGTDNDLVTYVYAPHPSAGFNGYGWHTNLGTEMQRGQWHHIKMEVKLNTVGSRDGVFKVWVDGRQTFGASDWVYRTNPDVKINAVLYDIHRGGGTTPPSWVSSRDSYIDLRNMMVRMPS
jgi:hypothetical protein